MTPDLRKLYAVSKLIGANEALVASDLLGEELETRLRGLIVEVCNAFDIPTIAERDPAADLAIAGDHSPENRAA